MPTVPRHQPAAELGWPVVPEPSVVVYPESDGKPMAETPVHMDAMMDTILVLRDRFAEREDVYVAGNMMMYHVEGHANVSVSPDVFVAFGCARDEPRRVWKTWEEGKLADFVLEVTSKATRGTDEGSKRSLYQQLGVGEYWQFDPTGDYLDPFLKGHRLGARGIYEPVPLTTRPEGSLYGESKVLSLGLCIDDDRLRMVDPGTGEFLLTHSESVAALAAERRRLAEKDRIIAEERRAREAAETELEALRRLR